jgi:hypothetical protein
MPKRERTSAEQRRDVRDAAVRRVLSLVELYSEMAESWLVTETYDAELVRRMLSTRETVLLLLESAMPLPLSAAELDDVRTESRAIH